MRSKILVLGHARHGKDTVAELLAEELNLDYKGSSEVCAPFVQQYMRDFGVFYSSADACFKDRAAHRPMWHQAIAEYCKVDKAALGKLIYATNAIYCGIRALDECDAIIAKFSPLVIWVDALDRLPMEPKSSMQLSYKEPWLRLSNNLDLEALQAKVKLLANMLR